MSLFAIIAMHYFNVAQPTDFSITISHIHDMNNIMIYRKIITCITNVHVKIVDNYLPLLIQCMHTHM